MIGFAIGIACLWGLVRILRGKRLWGQRHGGCGHGGWSSHRSCGRGPWRGGWGGGPGRSDWDDDDDPPFFFLRRLFRRLGTTPAQEKVIRTAVEEVIDAGRGFKDQVRGSRKDVADAFRSESFDETVMADLLTRHDDAIDEVRRAIVGSLAKIHEALDPDQRAELARWLERRGRWHGPYRSYA
jgi:hypothetical protein